MPRRSSYCATAFAPPGPRFGVTDQPPAAAGAEPELRLERFAWATRLLRRSPTRAFWNQWKQTSPSAPEGSLPHSPCLRSPTRVVSRIRSACLSPGWRSRHFTGPPSYIRLDAVTRIQTEFRDSDDVLFAQNSSVSLGALRMWALSSPFGWITAGRTTTTGVGRPQRHNARDSTHIL